VLGGFETLLQLQAAFPRPADIASPFLRRVTTDATTTTTGGSFPFAKMKSTLQHFRSIFDEQQAVRDGRLRPRPGLSAAYDGAVRDQRGIEARLEEYLREQRRAIGVSDINFWGTGKDR
jgi:hypothetical protein